MSAAESWVCTESGSPLSVPCCTACVPRRIADAMQTISLMPPEHDPRRVVTAILTDHTLGCACIVCDFVRAAPTEPSDGSIDGREISE